MFTDKRITKIPYWAQVIKHAHAIPPSIRDAATVEQVHDALKDACECHLQPWGYGNRLGITPCGEAVYFSQEGERDIEGPVLVKEGSKVTGGAK